MPTTPNALRKAVWEAIRKTINKFREHPYYFFTESDIHSYFYYCLYSSNYEIERDNRRIYLIHREYPTNFRYTKEALILADYVEPYPLSLRQGDRGNFDIAVINPDFVTNAPSVEDIVNKNVRLVEERVETDLDGVRRELLFAIEFKYVTRNTLAFVTEVIQDNKKLLFAKQWGAGEAVNLVFCNIEASCVQKVRQAVTEAPQDIQAFFSQVYYDNNQKRTPFFLSNVENERYAWLADQQAAIASDDTHNDAPIAETG
jgi:hypothetical protein